MNKNTVLSIIALMGLVMPACNHAPLGTKPIVAPATATSTQTSSDTATVAATTTTAPNDAPQDEPQTGTEESDQEKCTRLMGYWDQVAGVCLEKPAASTPVDASVTPPTRCTMVGNYKIDEGMKAWPVTAASSPSGTAIAVWDVDARVMRIYTFDLAGNKILSSSVRAPVNPTGTKMVGGNFAGVDTYIIAVPVTSPSVDNAYTSDYVISMVSKIETTTVAQLTGIQSIALAVDENGNFYSLEGTVGTTATSSTRCDNGNWETSVGSTDVTIRPLISVLKPNKTASFGPGMRIVDAAVVGDKVSIMVSGGYSTCGKPAFSYAFIETVKIFNDLNHGDTLVVSGKPGDYGAPNTINQTEDTGSIDGWSMFASKSFTGMYWMGQKSLGNGSFTRSFHVSKWNGMTLDPNSTVDGLSGYVHDRAVVLGWNDNLVAVSEGNGNTEVSLSIGTGDGKWDSSVIYTRDHHHAVKSFAGQGQHFVVLDGTDMVSGTYGAWGTFVTCN